MMTIFSLHKLAVVAQSICILLALSACDRMAESASTDNASVKVSPADAVEHTLDNAFILAVIGKTAEAATAFDVAISSKEFHELPEARRFVALEADGEAEETLGNHANAHALLVRATASSQSDHRAWHDRLTMAYELHDFIDSTHCLTVIARRWPEALKQIPGQSIWMVQASLGDDDKMDALRFDLFDALYEAHWKDARVNPSRAWRELTRMLLARHELAKAKQVAAEVDSTRIALSMRVDKRFDAITTGNPAFDIDRLAAANLEKARSVADRNPDDLESRILVISALLDLTRYEEALRLADETVAMANKGNGPKRFKDFDEHYNWILNDRERALLRLGRVDEAVRELERAARRPEDGGVNVSQAINLGGLYNELGRPSDALAIISNVGEMSPFGRMQLECVQLWASIQLHDVAAVARHMDYMRAHRADAMETWTNALVLAGNDDEAASELIARLRSEHWRSETLENLQDYSEVRHLPLESSFHRQWRAIYARPDVREAIRQLGRVESFRIDPSGA